MPDTIVKHRLFDLRIIIGQGVQYAMAPGTLLSVVPLLAAALVVDLLMHGSSHFLRSPGRAVGRMSRWRVSLSSPIRNDSAGCNLSTGGSSATDTTRINS